MDVFRNIGKTGFFIDTDVFIFKQAVEGKLIDFPPLKNCLGDKLVAFLQYVFFGEHMPFFGFGVLKQIVVQFLDSHVFIPPGYLPDT